MNDRPSKQSIAMADACIGAVWLFNKWLPLWERAQIMYVNRRHGIQVWLPNRCRHGNHWKHFIGRLLSSDCTKYFSTFDAYITAMCVRLKTTTTTTKKYRNYSLFVLFIFFRVCVWYFFVYKSISFLVRHKEIKLRTIPVHSHSILFTDFPFGVEVSCSLRWAYCFIDKCTIKKKWKCVGNTKGSWINAAFILVANAKRWNFSNLLIFFFSPSSFSCSLALFAFHRLRQLVQMLTC